MSSTLIAPHRHRAAPEAEAVAEAVADAEVVARRGDGPVRWVLRVLSWVVILACTAVLVLAVILPRLGGATPYTILTGSMAPGMPPGTLVVAKPAAVSDIAIGDVVTYQLESGKATVVTHRVVAVRTDMRGNVEFQTQGDANRIVDEKWVMPEQIRGERWYSVPYLGRLNVLLTGNERQLLVYGAAAMLVLYAASMFTSARRDRVRHQRT